MTDEIRKVAIDAALKGFDVNTSGALTWDEVGEAFLNALHAAGYEIVPTWSEDFSAVPRDGTPVRLYSAETGREYVASWMTSMEEGDGQWVYARHLSAENPVAFIVENPSHWKPTNPPKESE